MVKIALIVAVAENGVIGKNNDMPWHIKSEFQYFKRTTLGYPIISGRKNFAATGLLKGRANIVITRDTSFTAEGAIVVHTLDDAIATAQKIAAHDGKDKIFVVGGAEIYKMALPLVDTMYYTEVHLKPEGDIFFPPFDRALFTETKREPHVAQEGESGNYTITVLERIANTQ